MAKSFDTGAFKDVYACPDGLPHAIIDGCRGAFQVVTAACEVFFVLTSNYVLFIGREDLNPLVEKFAYSMLVFIWIICVGVFIHEDMMEGQQYCENLQHSKNGTTANREFFNYHSKADSLELYFWSASAVFVWAAYALLFVRWKQQQNIWKLHMKAQDQGYLSEDGTYTPPTTSKVDRKRREKMIETHRTAVKRVVDVLKWYILSFMFGSIGIVMQTIADHHYMTYSLQQSWFILWHSGGYIYNTQKILQSYAYFSTTDNLENYSWGAISRRMKANKGGEQRRVGFNSHLVEAQFSSNPLMEPILSEKEY